MLASSDSVNRCRFASSDSSASAPLVLYSSASIGEKIATLPRSAARSTGSISAGPAGSSRSSIRKIR